MIIGVTGTLASGKSTVARRIANRKNAKLLDADRMAHFVLGNDSSVHLKLVSFFGERLLDKKGKIDRKKLASVVFSDRDKLKFLCSVIHPRVINEIKESTEEAFKRNKNAFVVIDAPLLIEAGLVDFCDLVVVVTASVAKSLERVEKHNGLSRKETLKRIRAQMPISEKEKYADYVIRNDGSIQELKVKVDEVIEKIR